MACLSSAEHHGSVRADVPPSSRTSTMSEADRGHRPNRARERSAPCLRAPARRASRRSLWIVPCRTWRSIARAAFVIDQADGAEMLVAHSGTSPSHAAVAVIQPSRVADHTARRDRIARASWRGPLHDERPPPGRPPADSEASDERPGHPASRRQRRHLNLRMTDGRHPHTHTRAAHLRNPRARMRSAGMSP